jgi:hypothetical protein
MLAAGPNGAAAQSPLYDYVGFDYEDPDPDSGQFGELGSGYVGLGEVPNIFAPLVANQAANEYTYHINGLVSLVSVPVGPFIVVTYAPGGFIDLYEDDRTLGTAAAYGINPPNGTAPSDFIDGTLMLRGKLTNFQFVYNTGTGSGSFEATFEAVGGAQLGNIPANQRTGWTFAGVTSNDLDIPAGYDHQVDGQVFLDRPTATRSTTLGRLKADYR